LSEVPGACPGTRPAGTPERPAAELLWTRAGELPGPGAITGLLGLPVENGQLDRAKASATGHTIAGNA
jgi:hypothetical protein